MVRLAQWFLFAGVLIGASASLAVDGVEVAALTFRLVELDRADDRWYEATALLSVERDYEDSVRLDSRYLDNLEVNLSIGIENIRGGERAFRFYSSSVVLVTLGEGKHRIRFYLPPEVVERDRLRGEPHSFSVILKRDNTVLEEFYSPNLSATVARQSFVSRVSEERAKADGILRPQHKTPFFEYYLNETPTARLLK